eukprot:gene6826-9346_t
MLAVFFTSALLLSFFIDLSLSSSIFLPLSFLLPSISLFNRIHFNYMIQSTNLVSIVNSTIGHSNAILSLGLEIAPKINNSVSFELESLNNNVEEINLISNEELLDAQKLAYIIINQTEKEILKLGWKPVHVGNLFSLYKRRIKGSNGPVEYLMTGYFPDVSARTFLFSQIDKNCRKLWDKTMKEMSDGTIKHDIPEESSMEDILYYRTRWPWPLKDRDYSLARRCKVFKDKQAIVLISKSTETDYHPRNDGVIRVDNYWCHSVFIANDENNKNSKNNNDNTNLQNDKSSINQENFDRINNQNSIGSTISTMSQSMVGKIGSQWFGNSPSPTSQSSKQYFSVDKRSVLSNILQLPYGGIGVQINNKELANSYVALPYKKLPFTAKEYYTYKMKKRNDIIPIKRRVMRNQKIINVIKKNVNSYLSLSYIKRFALINNIQRMAHDTSSEGLEQEKIMIDNDNSSNENLSNYDINNNEASLIINEPELSIENNDIIKIDYLGQPGMRFVTIFCDDQKIPLPPQVMDFLSKQAEKVVPGSIEALHKVATQIESNKQNKP